MIKRPLPFISIMFIGLAFVGFSAFTKAVSQEKVIDMIVAQVGNEIILLSDIQGQKLAMIQEGMEVSNATDCDILEGLLYEKLLINQAAIDSVEIPADMVNATMDEKLRIIADKFGSMEALEEFYGKSTAQIKAEFFERIRKNMLAERMMQLITENVTITPKEVTAFYKNLKEEEIPYINSKVVVAQLVIYPQILEADKAIARQELEGYRKQIITGFRSFETLATLYSDDPGSRLSGGDLGWNSRGTMVPEFEAELFKLEKDSISPVFETIFGYHIIKMVDRKGDNYRCKHILVSPEASDRSLIKADNKMDSIYKAITRGTITFEEAAMQFSDDENSKQNGGKIVNPYTGDYFWDIQNINDIDPQMSQLLQSLKVGQYSAPTLYENYFERKSGLRMVKLVSKTKPHMANLTDDYQLIQMAALNEKKQEAIDNWINEKIQSTFIKIHEDYLKGCTFKYNWVKVGS